MMVALVRWSLRIIHACGSSGGKRVQPRPCTGSISSAEGGKWWIKTVTPEPRIDYDDREPPTYVTQETVACGFPQAAAKCEILAATPKYPLWNGMPINTLWVVHIPRRMVLDDPPPFEEKCFSCSQMPNPIFDLDEAVRRCFGQYALFQDMAGHLFSEADSLVE